MIRKKDELGGILAFEDHLVVLGSRPVNIRVVIVTGSVGEVLGSLWVGKWKWVNSISLLERECLSHGALPTE